MDKVQRFFNSATDEPQEESGVIGEVRSNN